MKQIILIFLLFIAANTHGQTVNDVLKKGRIINKDRNLFLYFSESDNKLHYSIREINGTAYSYKLIDDSTLFLVKHHDGVLVYYAPVNPLKRAYTDTTFDLIDESNKASDEALVSYANVVAGLASNTKLVAGKTSPAKNKQKIADCFTNIKTAYSDVKMILDNNKKEDIKDVFQKLSNIPFTDGPSTDKALVAIGADTFMLHDHFNQLEAKITTLEKAIRTFNCDASYDFLAQFTLGNILDVVKTKRDEQKSRYTTLLNCYRLVADACSAAKATQNKPEWSLGPVELSFSDKKISYLNVKYEQSGFEINKDNEIIKAEHKTLANRTFKFRRYNFFVPEVLPGVAFINVDFPKFGTITDSAGKIRVASAGNDNVKRMNITTMVNFNIHTVNSSLNPFIQTGVGFNFQSPSLLLGGGLRIPIESKGVLSISTGVAFTWVKTLTELKEGDVVAGDADVEKDVALQFNNNPKFYLGIQVKL